MPSPLLDSRRYRRRLSVSLPDHTADELLRLAPSSGIPVATLIRDARRRALPAIRRGIKRHASETAEERKQ